MAAPRLAFFTDDWGKFPVLKNEDGSDAEGPRAIRLIIDVTATAQSINLGAMLAEQILTNVQSVKIDNADNAGQLTIQSQLSGDRLQIGGNSQAILPWVFTINDNAFNIVLSTGTGSVILWLYNTPKPAAVWSSIGGEAVTIVDGGNVTFGAKADAAATDNTGSFTFMAFVKRLLSSFFPATATVSRFGVTAGNQTLLVANANRRGGVIYNEVGSAVFYVKFGSNATATSYTYAVQPGATLEIPVGYTGRIDAIGASALGNAQVTEIAI